MQQLQLAAKNQEPSTIHHDVAAILHYEMFAVIISSSIVTVWKLEQADEDAASSQTLHMTEKLDSLTPKVKNHFATTELVN